MPATVENLPAEIQTLLFCHLTDIQSLLSLVGTSSVFLHVYRRNRDVIYIKVVCNYIGIKLLPIAIATARLRNLTDPINVNMFLDIVNNLEHDQNLTDMSAISVQDARQLLLSRQFYDKLTRDIIIDSIIYLRSHPALKEVDPHGTDVNSSRFERYRVLRGLYNWEVISLVSQRNLRAIRKDPSNADRFLDCLKRFLNRLATYELGEISFVLYHLRERLSHFLDQAEEDRFAEFIDRGPGLPHFDWEDDGDNLDPFFSRALRAGQDDWITRTMWTQDLHAFYGILSLETPEARLDFIEETESIDHALVLLEQLPPKDELNSQQHSSLTSLKYSPAFIDWKVPVKIPLHDRIARYRETVEDSNLGLLWAYSQTQRCHSFNLLDEISALGLVVWDKQRLRDMGVFVRELGFWHSDERSFFKTRRKKPSVEQRAFKQELEWKAQSS